jgi:ATP/ADP translocase/HEAT repeat protein
MKKVLRKILGTSFDIRKGEWGLVLLMVSNYFFILLAYYLLKPTRDALFLVKVSETQLPYVYILIALFSAPFIAIYNKVSQKAKFNDVVALATLVIIATLIGIKFLMKSEIAVIYYFFYIWVSVLGALITSQFWIFANAVFDATQAKRIFTILGIGGIAGAFVGSQLTTILVSKSGFNLSSEDLLYVASAFLALTVIFFRIVWKKRVNEGIVPATKPKARATGKESSWAMFKTVKRSRYLTLIIVIASMTVILATFVDFQFKVISKQAYPNKEELAGFLAQINAWLSIGSLLIQGLFTNRFLRYFGVTGILLVLPVAQLIAFTFMLVMPGIAAGIMMRSAESSLRYSMDKTGKELLFLPVPIDITRRMKTFLDVFVDRWARGLGGAILVLFTITLAMDVQYLSIVAIVLTILWLSLTLPMRKEFVEAFRRAIEKRQIDPSELRLKVDDAQSLNAIIASLGSSNERQVVYALKMLDSVEDKELKWPVKPLLENNSAEVRLNALKVLLRLGDASDLPDVEKLLMDPNIEIRADAMRFISAQSDQKMSKLVRGFLSHSDRQIRHAAISCIANYGEESDKALISNQLIDEILSYRGPHDVAGRIQIALALGNIDLPDSNKYLRKLLEDDSREVKIAAIQSIGKQKEREFVPWLIINLSDSELRTHCREALARFSIAVLGTLHDYLNDDKQPLTVRRHIPRVMALIPNQEAVNFLINSLESQNSWLTYDVLKGLSKLRAKSFELKFNEKEIETVLINETRHFYEVLQILNSHNGGESPQALLLKKSLRERLDANLEKIFRLMGLQYPPRDIYNAYLSIVSDRKIERAKALEFLENLLNANIKRYVLPILDEISPDVTVQKGRELFKLGISTEEEGLCALIKGRNVWLKVCALYNVKNGKSEQVMSLVKGCVSDPDPMVRETAKLALTKIGSQS